MNIIEGFKHLTLAASAVLALYFPSSQTAASIFNINGQYSYSGQTLKYSVNIPKNGGKVTGKFSGVCNGPIEGNYLGPVSGEIEGRAGATCLILLNRKLTVSYIAHLNLEKGKAYIDWTGDIPYTPGKGSFTMDFEPVN